MSSASPSPSQAIRSLRSLAGSEWFLAISLGSCLVLFALGDRLWAHMASWPALAFILLWLFATVLGAAVSVVRHAERLAELLGEPFGTLILTLSVTLIEVVSIAAVMLHGEENPTLARDTLFAVVMIILNGMVGLSLLIGGWRHREQTYNLQGANVYLGAVVPLIVLSLVLPDFTETTQGPTLSGVQQIFLVVVSVGLYVVFLTMQTGRHRDYFTLTAAASEHMAVDSRPRSNAVVRHAALLLIHLLPALFLAEKFGRPVNYVIETLHAPVALGGVLVALLVATPEAIGAARAAMANQLQRSVNIFLGSILSTVSLTVPAIVLISRLTGQNIILGVQHTDLVMLLLTLTVSIVTFSSGRTNVIQGAVHLILFAAYLLLIIQN